jgi:type IV pilus assembly protein PilV
MMENKLNKMNRLFSSRGFSLIEIMIAISIFAIGFLAMASLQIAAGKNNRTGSEVTEAATIATDKMEWIMVLPFDDPDLDPALNPHLDNQGKYDIQWRVKDADLNDDGTNDSKIIEMTVSWARIDSAANRAVNIDFIKPDI